MAGIGSPRAAVRVMAVLAAMVSLATLPSYGLGTGPRYLPDRLLVKFYPGTPASEVARAHARVRGTVAGEIPHIGVQVVNLPAYVPPGRAIGYYADNPNVQFVEPDAAVEPDAIPNDPSYPSQWHLPKIGGPAAWDWVTGSSTITIAILDTGVYGGHLDLAPKMVPGWNTYDGNSDTSDVYGHGTAVAGVAAAYANNGIGLASPAWDCRIMPIRISDLNGWAYPSTAASGLTWAADHGARVANISYGVTGSSTVAEAARYFQSRGGVVTSSAGNDGLVLSTPDSPYILTVSATDSADNVTSWSNTGNCVDLAAPGYGILATERSGGYASRWGTSFSAPIVAGVAALVLSADPLLSGQQAYDILRQSALDLGSEGWDPRYGCGRVDAAAAVALALGAAPDPDTQPPTVAFMAPSDGATVRGTVEVQVLAEDDVAISSVTLSLDGSPLGADSSTPYVFTWGTTAVSNGSHVLAAVAEDTSGNTSTAQITVNVSNLADSVPPTVAITAPADGTAVKRSLRVAVSATDDTGVARVELYLNGVLCGTSSTAPFTFSLDTRQWPPGVYVLQARAYDAEGNNAWSEPVSVTKQSSTKPNNGRPSR